MNNGLGYMDAIEMLVAQHRALEALLGQVLDARDETSLEARFARAGDELTMHLSAEELIFYPAVKARRSRTFSSNCWKSICR